MKMPLMIIYSCFIAFLLSFEQIAAAAGKCITLVVDQSRNGKFSTIQSAIDSIPSNNRYWYCINVNAGTYREKVKIPYDKPFIIFKGAGIKNTKVIWNEPTLQNPTFQSSADYIIVKAMSFVNSYNSPSSKNPRSPAVAAMISGDKSLFYRCGFSSVQDTLWDDNGRHYFKECWIEGAVDFIFGNGQSIYEDSWIRYRGEMLKPGYVGYITAQARNDPSESSGFVFKNCNVFGKGTTFLGRPWRGLSRVLFYNCRFSDIIHPSGWDASRYSSHEQRLTFAENGNRGPGSDTSKRVSWESKLDRRTLGTLTSMAFIDTDKWLESMPVNLEHKRFRKNYACSRFLGFHC